MLLLGTVPAYAASKAAVHSLSQSIATAYGKRDIRCNTIAPGFIDTPTTRNMGDHFFQMTLDNNVLPYLRRPEDIAQAAVRATTGPDFPVTFRWLQWKQQDYHCKIAQTPRELVGTLLTPIANAALAFGLAPPGRLYRADEGLYRRRRPERGRDAGNDGQPSLWHARRHGRRCLLSVFASWQFYHGRDDPRGFGPYA